MPTALEPFVPSPGDPWDAAKAAHLLRRAGCGPLPQEVAEAVASGPDRAVDALFAFPPEPDSAGLFDEVRAAEQQADDARRRLPRVRLRDNPELRALYQEAQREHGRAIVGLTAWWLDRLARTPAPLQEKLTLFWHGHFTSSFGDVHDAIAMYNQNQLFRRHAAGNFARLLDGVARDPAMLRYLNNDENRRGHPNENWARELMELFTMGIGHYTEADIKESARAWTGWTLRDYRSYVDRRTFAFKPLLHDGGTKTFLDQSGAWDGTDIMRIILAHPATPQWIAGRLARFFVSPQPDPGLVDALAQQLYLTGYEVAPALRALFRSRAFYGQEVMYTQVKSPTQLIVGAVRHLGIADPDWVRLSQAMAGMGQRLFFPPTVAGWHGEAAWMNAGTVFARTDVLAGLVAGAVGSPDLSAFSSLDAVTSRLLGRSLPTPRRSVLSPLAAGGVTPEVLHLTMSMPEYQVA
jgi:uncharacterized protein (DUF1800 family)